MPLWPESPLSSLDIHGCSNVDDLSPLKDMPLTTLRMYGVAAADLSPLAGLPLENARNPRL